MDDELTNMLESYRQMSINDQKNELNILMNEMNLLISNALQMSQLDTPYAIKNYNSNTDSGLDESQFLLFAYEDLWRIKTNLTLLIMNILENLK